MQAFEELFEFSKSLKKAAATGDVGGVEGPLEALNKAANETKRSFSGSWQGYHSRVYYENLAPPPPGANFSQEWGLMDMSYTSLGSHGEWREYDFRDVERHIYDIAGNPNLDVARKSAKNAEAEFNRAKSEIVSIFESELHEKEDAFLAKLKSELERLEPLTKSEIAQRWAPKGQFMTRDTIVIGQGAKVPPHIDVLADVASISQPFAACKAASDIVAKAASYLERKSRKKVAAGRIGTNVFVGHGRSTAWRELTDFVQDRLGLPWDEFNRVPVAGVTNIARLSEMLDAAAIALLVMTAEDEMADGGMQARLNVVHEAGLFQGRLGFTRAIVLLEEGCSEFSNIQGLGQIRFPKGNISAVFEEVRRVLEREGLIDDSN